MPSSVTAYIGLGGNLGNPRATIVTALETLDRLPGVVVEACSSCYRSAALTLPGTPGAWRQPDYVNAVARLGTRLPPLQLLRRMQGIEKRLGRLRTGRRWAARRLDLDLLLYGDRRIHLPRLRVPHPAMAERAFVLVPLAEVAPRGLRIPGVGPLDAMLAYLPDNTLESMGGCDADG